MSEEGCVRVAVRIRPLLPKEILHNHQVCVRVVPDSAQVMLGADRTFLFDYAFGPSAQQAEVYESCVRPLLTSLLDGNNATVFAYGQTGSGKTYTLGGGHVAVLPEEEGGIVSRVAQDLFSLLGERSEEEASVRVSYVELYMEELRDLLELDTNHKELHIREDDRGNTVVVGASETAVTSAEELLSVLAAGDALRHTGSTQMNERSSRSHAILTLQLAQRRRPHHGPARCSKLHLVDLAGSERASRTGNTGQRLKESVNINAGLLALGNVIRALTAPSSSCAGRSGHVPYRDAKITRLLRDSLGGSAHTLMVACVSPAHPCVAETLSALQFASRARRVRNRPGACPGAGGPCPGWDPREARIEELEHEVRALREALKGRGGADSAGRGDRYEPEPDREAKREEEEVEEEEEPRSHGQARDAALLLEELQSLPPGVDARGRLQDWLERQAELGLSVPLQDPGPPAGTGSEETRDVTVQQLRRELKRCQEALAVDEDVLEQKEAELREVRREVKSLLLERRTQLQALQEEREHRRIQSDRLVEQQLQIDRLRADLLASRAASSGASLEGGASGTPAARRPHSVPLLSQASARQGSRKIQTSPPACSLERVMAAFRTRSQLLLAQIEERDEVLCPGSAQEEGQGEEEEEEGEEEEGEEQEGGTKRFRRSLNRTWTSKQNQSQEPDSAQNHKNPAHLPDLTAGGEGSSARRSRRRRKAELQASHAQRIQELSVNIRLKEELIKELDKTGKEVQAVDRLFAVDQRKTEAQIQGPGHGRGQGALARLSQQVQLSRAELQRSVEHLRLQMQDLQTDHHNTGLTSSREPWTEDPSVCQNGHSDDSKTLTDRRVWLEQEEDLLLQRRWGLQELEEELRRWEEVLLHREACLQERNQLELKRLRSSQTLSQDLLRVSAQLGAVEAELGAVEAELAGAWAWPAGGVALEELQEERDGLRRRKDDLESQLRDGRLLTVQEPWTEDPSVCQNGHSDDSKTLTDRRVWLEQEEELALQRRWGLQELEEELRWREEVLLHREACLQARNQLELKRLRSSQEEHTLLQLEEAVEALDAAVEFKNRSIQERQRLLGGPAHTHIDPANPAHSDVMRKLRELSLPEASALLVKYFNKVVCLRERERGLRLRCQELRLHAEDQGAAVREMEAVLRRLTLDTDRRLTQQHREHQHSIQLLLQQLQVVGGGGPGVADQAVQARLQQLERDLFFYKSTSRELKRKLRELAPDSQTPPPSSHARPPAHGRKEGDRDGAGQAELTPVRLSRRELRQIAPADRPRGRSNLTSSWDSSFQEDSIEVPRN